MKANLRHADRLNVPVLVIYGERERASGRPIVRDMRTRDEIGVDRVDLEVTVRSRL
jgi:histidyl-tRNA synthetase